MRRPFALLALALGLVACLAPPGPAERLGYSAYELNTATRFGRMDIALSHVAAGVQAEFSGRHRDWGRAVRIVDVDLLGMQLQTPDLAEVEVAVSWHRIDDTILRQTTVAQKWTQQQGDWRLSEELRTGGDQGLYAELARHDKRRRVEQALSATSNVDLPD
jgi:hypothetical protein